MGGAKVRMRSCLIVDDSKVIRMIARKIMQSLDFGAIEAANGREALEVCKRGMPTVVLVDWTMPEMGGIDYVKALRRLPGGDAPVVIFCTTETDVEHIRAAIEAGANEYIMKPFDGEIVRAKLAQVGLL